MNQKNHWMKTAVLGLCAALLLSGCGGKTSGSDESTKKTDASSSSSSDVSSDIPEGYSKYNYYSLNMIHTSEDILDEIWVQMEAANAETDPENDAVLPKIDMTTLSSLFDQFQEAYDGLNRALEDETEREKVFNGPDGESAMKLYTDKVESLYSWVNKLSNDLTEGADYTEDFNKVNEAISSMIDGYNSII